jgi:hypothetical protein
MEGDKDGEGEIGKEDGGEDKGAEIDEEEKDNDNNNDDDVDDDDDDDDDDDGDDDDAKKPKGKGKKQIRVFNPDWIDKAEFKDCILPTHDRVFVYDDDKKELRCQFCIDNNKENSLHDSIYYASIFFLFRRREFAVYWQGSSFKKTCEYEETFVFQVAYEIYR